MCDQNVLPNAEPHIQTDWSKAGLDKSQAFQARAKPFPLNVFYTLEHTKENAVHGQAYSEGIKKKKRGKGRLVKPGIPIVHSQIYASENVFLPFEELNYGVEKW